MMSVDLQMLVWTAILCVLQAFPYTLALIAKVGPVRAVSYPQPGEDALPEWARRSKRAHLNLVQNIAPFAIVVLVAQALGAANETTALGATVFFWSRVVMAVGHTMAIPFLRSIAWFVSLAGIVMILTQIL
ncbi:MAG: MAPEG family protein [Dongiaceae bacterium]